MTTTTILNRYTHAVIHSGDGSVHQVLEDGIRRGISFEGADLQGANLDGADLRGADLRYANLRDAEIRDADLICTKLRNANLRGADLICTKLRNANLRGADLEDAGLYDADLRNADLRNANLIDSIMIGADLRGADLWGADLWGADLRDADLTDIGLELPDPIELRRRVRFQIESHPESWDQEEWHSKCGTRHCVAGWTIVLAGDIGTRLEDRCGTSSAAHILLGGKKRPSFEPSATLDDVLAGLEES